MLGGVKVEYHYLPSSVWRDGWTFQLHTKSALRKHAAKFERQWDKFLPGILWSYRNTPQDSTGEKPSFLLFGLDCKSPTEATFVHGTSLYLTDLFDYWAVIDFGQRIGLQMHQVSSEGIQEETWQEGHVAYDYKLGEWELVIFPQKEVDQNSKLSNPGMGHIVWLDTVTQTWLSLFSTGECHYNPPE